MVTASGPPIGGASVGDTTIVLVVTVWSPWSSNVSVNVVVPEYSAGGVYAQASETQSKVPVPASGCVKEARTTGVPSGSIAPSSGSKTTGSSSGVEKLRSGACGGSSTESMVIVAAPAVVSAPSDTT